MRAASTAWTVAGTCRLSSGLRQTIGAPLPDQHPGLHQGAHALLQEEGIALRAGNQELRERRQAGIVPQQGLEQAASALAGAAGRAGAACSTVLLPQPCWYSGR